VSYFRIIFVLLFHESNNDNSHFALLTEKGKERERRMNCQFCLIYVHGRGLICMASFRLCHIE